MAIRNAIEIVLSAKDEASSTLMGVSGQFDNLRDHMSNLAAGLENTAKRIAFFEGRLGGVALSFAKTAIKIGALLFLMRQLRNMAMGTASVFTRAFVNVFKKGIPNAISAASNSIKRMRDTWRKNLKETGSFFGAAKKSAGSALGGIEGLFKSAGGRAAIFSVGLIGVVMAFKAIGLAIDLAKKALDFFLRSVNEGIEMAHEQEVITNKLVVAMSRYGGEVDKNIASAKSYASNMQLLSTFSNEQVESVQTLLLNMGVLPKNLNEATKAAANLATTYDKDLTWAGEKLAESLQGQTGELKKFVPGIEDLDKKALKAGKAMGLVNKQFDKAAVAELSTYRGLLAQFKNSWDDLKKAMGEFVIQGDFGKKTIRTIAFMFEFLTLKIKNAMFILRKMREQKVWELAFANVGEMVVKPMELALKGLSGFLKGLAAVGRFSAKIALFGGERMKRQADDVAALANQMKILAESVRLVGRAEGEAFGKGVSGFLPGSVPPKGRDFGPRGGDDPDKDEEAAKKRLQLLDAEQKAAMRVKDAQEALRQARLEASDDIRRGSAKIEADAADKRREFALQDFDFAEKIKDLGGEVDLSDTFKSFGVSAGTELMQGIQEGMEGEEDAFRQTVRGLLPIVGALLGSIFPALGTGAGGAIGGAIAGFLHTGSAGYMGQAHTGVGLRSDETFRVLKDEMVLNRQAVQALGGEGRVLAAQAGIGGAGGDTYIINTLDTQTLRDSLRRGPLGRELVVGINNRRGQLREAF